jgi:putative DNA primase/helicase
MSNIDHKVFEQFTAAADRRNLVLPTRIIPDGRIHRCDVKGKRGKRGKGDGSYLLHVDGVIPAGGLNNWTDGVGWENWRLDVGRELEPGEKRELARKYEAARVARDEERARTLAKARAKSARLWNGAPRASSHPYLTKKHIEPNGARLLYGNLIVPLRNADGAIQNLQFIRADDTKYFLNGSAVTGFFYRIDGDTDRICIAEGFATAATIHAVTGRTVIVAFDAANLGAVAKVIRQKHPDAEIVICADDDKSGVGVTEAKAAAQATNGLVAVPDFGRNRRERDSDFNDLAELIGVDAVRRCIEAATAPPVRTPEGDQAVSTELAKLPPIEYDRRRKAAADELGISVGALDKAVAGMRAKPEDKTVGQGRPLDLPVIEPWPEPVDGAKLLDDITDAIKKYVKLRDEEAHAVPSRRWLEFVWWRIFGNMTIPDQAARSMG